MHGSAVIATALAVCTATVAASGGASTSGKESMYDAMHTMDMAMRLLELHAVDDPDWGRIGIAVLRCLDRADAQDAFTLVEQGDGATLIRPVDQRLTVSWPKRSRTQVTAALARAAGFVHKEAGIEPGSFAEAAISALNGLGRGECLPTRGNPPAADRISVAWQDLGNGIGYLRIAEFLKRTPGEVSAALDQLRTAGVTGVVLDLRGNAGGLVDSAFEVAALLLKDGQAVYHTTGRGRDSNSSYVVATKRPPNDVPLVVLTNGDTAAGAEILAAALQDSMRARLVGTRTAGQGSVRLLTALPDGRVLSVTIQHWTSPKGRAIEGAGVTPDVEVAAPAAIDLSQPDPAKDPQLRRGLELMSLDRAHD